jgi:putative heme iron utilization protein
MPLSGSRRATGRISFSVGRVLYLMAISFLTRKSSAFQTLPSRLLTFGKPFHEHFFDIRRSDSFAPTAFLATLETIAAVNGENSTTSIPLATATPNNIRLNVNEKARTVTSVCTSGTLCTKSTHPGIEDAPFGSFVDYVLDDSGNPILLMNEMSMHTINIQSCPIVTLFTQLGSKEGQDVSRCSLTGLLEKMQKNDVDMDMIRMRYSITHAYADQVMDSPKFAFYRLTPQKIYFVGGFGVMAKWVEPVDYYAAAPDILAKDAASIVARINRDHGDDLRTTAIQLLGVTNEIEAIRMTSVDRLGMDIRVTFQMGTRRNKLQTDEFRIGFRIPVQSVEDAKSEILKAFQEAWEKGNGMAWGESQDLSPGSTIPIVKIAADSLE